MADNSAIEWTDATWNPVTGCTKITRGCDNCYAARFAERWRGVPGHPYEQGFDLHLWPARLDQPERWRKRRMIFVNSMSDLFHKDVPREFIDKVFDRMETVNRHTYQVLTKRSSLMRDYLKRRYGEGMAPKHIWCGVSVEDSAAAGRIRHLQDAPAAVRFLSAEPLLGPVGEIDLEGISWVIAGGESGPGARPMHLEWVRALRDRCALEGVPFFFKQWGGARPKAGGRLLDGKEWNGFPGTLRRSSSRVPYRPRKGTVNVSAACAVSTNYWNSWDFMAHCKTSWDMKGRFAMENGSKNARDPAAAHQPSKAEFEMDVSVCATPEAQAWAVTGGGTERRKLEDEELRLDNM